MSATPRHPSLWVREAQSFPAEATAPPARAEVVLIGIGVAGASAALALAERGVDVVAFEAGAIAGRASGRNDGQVLLGLGEHYNRIVGQFGLEEARALWRFIEANHARLERLIDELAIDCGFERAGGLRLAETPHEQDELMASAALLAAEDVEHELLDRAALRARMPAAHGFFGALRLPGEAVVQPAKLVRGLAAGARRAGARIYEHAPVVEVSGESGNFRVHIEDGSTIDCAVVVHCTSTLARELDPTGFLAEQVFPFRGQIVASEPLPDDVVAGFGSEGMSSNFCYEYFRIHDRRFVVGGMRWSVPGEEQGILDDTTVNPDVSVNLRRWVDDHFPSLRGRAFPEVWTGIMAGTGDGLPLCGALPELPGAFALLAFNGYGLSFATEAGATLAEQITDGKSSRPAAAMFAPRRFSG